jgi:hypothetical protein
MRMKRGIGTWAAHASLQGASKHWRQRIDSRRASCADRADSLKGSSFLAFPVMSPPGLGLAKK